MSDPRPEAPSAERFSPGGFFGCLLFGLLPVLGPAALFVWAFSSRKPHARWAGRFGLLAYIALAVWLVTVIFSAGEVWDKLLLPPA